METDPCLVKRCISGMLHFDSLYERFLKGRSYCRSHARTLGMADQQRRNPLLGCHKERFPSTWPGVSSLPKDPAAKEPVAAPYTHDYDELPKWNTTKRLGEQQLNKHWYPAVCLAKDNVML